MEFNPDPNCSTCGGDLGWPGSYNESMGVDYTCTMCGMMDATTYIPVAEMPTEYLHRLFTYASRVDASIKMDEKTPRFDALREAVKTELEDRGETVTQIELTHRVQTNKEQANLITDSFPGFFTIGSTPDGIEYDLGTPREDMEWESFVSQSEANRLEEWDNVTVEKR